MNFAQHILPPSRPEDDTNRTLACHIELTDIESSESNQLHTADPEAVLRGVGALHRLAERVETLHVDEVRRVGWPVGTDR
ncbi:MULTISPECIES: hypothetical protein [unclassified Rhodococcus (in: high G+C Gram-positive bacteria)]|uniref:hypothetical protein n=1 Tax=unclassified Rhodococcus (in: high G+C Gram-positive bacteria) TaxID=192944 RepID=UPI001B350762|nr:MULTISPECIES: hypothetical protein [unclassified Rhodococcus (in: high G+C Gram-positive bacteria)]